MDLFFPMVIVNFNLTSLSLTLTCDGEWSIKQFPQVGGSRSSPRVQIDLLLDDCLIFVGVCVQDESSTSPLPHPPLLPSTTPLELWHLLTACTSAFLSGVFNNMCTETSLQGKHFKYKCPARAVGA